MSTSRDMPATSPIEMLRREHERLQAWPRTALFAGRRRQVTATLVELAETKAQAVALRAYHRWCREQGDGEPSWRLPARDWLTKYVDRELRDQGYFRLTAHPPGLSKYDDLLRRALDDIEKPFLPLHRIRTATDPLDLAHLDHQTLQALSPEERHVLATWQVSWQHPAQPLIDLLRDPRVCTDLPEGTVTHRTVRTAAAAARGTTPHEQWVTAQLLKVKPGDVLRFAGPLSSTTRTYRTRAHDDWTDEKGHGVRWEPRVVLLELAPRRGVYLGPETVKAIASALDEGEVIHPPDTYWKVRGNYDLVYADRGRDAFDGKFTGTLRHPTIQLEEIDAAAADVDPVEVDTHPEFPDRTWS